MTLKEVEQLQGTISRVTYKNPTNGYSVIQVDLEDTKDTIVVVGICSDAQEGVRVSLKGRFITHAKYGKQFTATAMTTAPPATAEGIKRYLASGLISGIGFKTAERLVRALGNSTLEIIRTDPERVAKIPGVGEKKAKTLQTALLNQTEFQSILQFLVEQKISPTLGAKIFQKFGDKTLAIIKENPYQLAREIRGIGFHTADSIAQNMGIDALSLKRVQAGIYFALLSAGDDGHCYLPETVLIERAAELLRIEQRDVIQRELHSLRTTKELIQYGDGTYLPKYHEAESEIAKFVASRSQTQSNVEQGDSNIARCISDAEVALGITLSDEQRHAVELATTHPLVLITGGPGCGKTTVTKALTVAFAKANRSYALAAPTGKAAQRIAQVCGGTASTIHRLLKFDPITSGFIHNASNPLPYDAIIIDEASMIDTLLAKDLLSAIPDSCALILVGDRDQLPSVGPGKVFADILRCDHVKAIQLSTIFRRDSESYINTVAYMINTGQMPDIPIPDGNTKSDAYLIEKQGPAEIAKLIENLFTDQIPRKFGIPSSDISILTPTNRGPLGTIELNKAIQHRIHSETRSSSSSQLKVGEHIIRCGDKVVQRVNNYKIDPYGVFNGDTGNIIDIDSSDDSLQLELWDGRIIKYTKAELHQLSLAYVSTVHRAQGMEVPCVILVVDKSHYTLLERQLMYTAATRAKKLLIIVGSKQALLLASKRTHTKRRCTSITLRIQHNLGLSAPHLDDGFSQISQDDLY
jgi:exodeoxyribonuclease V alpha subunit